MIWRRIDHQYLDRLVADCREHVLHVWREEAGVTGTELAALTVDLRPCAAFQHIANLLDAGMRMRQRAFAFFHNTEHDFDLLCAHRLRADQPAVHSAGVVGRRIRLHAVGLDEVAFPRGHER